MNKQFNDLKHQENPRDLFFSIYLFRNFIEANYLYVISACFMMMGCFLLMRSSLIDGTEFIKTLKTLLILQGYELLVIATAILIVRKLKFLGDAFTLLIIELALLLDPTFFANSFITMNSPESLAVNIVCCILVPIKLYILLKALDIKISRSAFAAFCFSALILYVVEGRLYFIEDQFGLYGFYYLLWWTPLIFCLIMPSIEKIASSNQDNEKYITERQQEWLPRFFLFMPLIILFLHFIESSWVYNISFSWLNLSPFIIAICILMINNSKKQIPEDIMLIIDIFSIIALIFSIRWIHITGRETLIMAKSAGPVQPTPQFINSIFPPIACGIGVCLLYIYFYWKCNYKKALYRVAVLICLVILGLFWKTGVPGAFFSFLNYICRSSFSWLGKNPWIFVAFIWMALAAFSWFFRAFFSWLIFGIYTASIIFHYLPVENGKWIPEFLQCCFGLSLVLNYIFKRDRNSRYLLTGLIMIFALYRFISNPVFWTGGIVILEIATFLTLGFLIKEGWHILLGLSQFSIAVIFAGIKMRDTIPPALFILAGGLLLFFFGIVVTFRKKSILVWIENMEEKLAESPFKNKSNIEPLKVPPAEPGKRNNKPLHGKIISGSDLVEKMDKAEEKYISEKDEMEKEELILIDEDEEGIKQDTAPDIKDSSEDSVNKNILLDDEYLEKIKGILELLFLDKKNFYICTPGELDLETVNKINNEICRETGEEMQISISRNEKNPEDWSIILGKNTLLLRIRLSKDE
jgi:hypothetical protein